METSKDIFIQEQERAAFELSEMYEAGLTQEEINVQSNQYPGSR